jgi:hypothetical protein
MEMDLKNREVRVTILLTPEERAELKAAAERLGLKEGTYIRMKALEAARSGNA